MLIFYSGNEIKYEGLLFSIRRLLLLIWKLCDWVNFLLDSGSKSIVANRTNTYQSYTLAIFEYTTRVSESLAPFFRISRNYTSESRKYGYRTVHNWDWAWLMNHFPATMLLRISGKAIKRAGWRSMAINRHGSPYSNAI